MAASGHRPKASLNLTVQVPVKAEIDEICNDILNGKSIITVSGLEMTPVEVDRLIAAFNNTEHTFESLKLITAFTSKKEDRTEDLKKLWDAVKTKVKSIDFKDCTIPKSFRDHMSNEIRESKKDLTYGIKKEKPITVLNYSLELCSDASLFSPSGSPPIKRSP